MKCLVCGATSVSDGPCPQCGHVAREGAPDMQEVLAAREVFKNKSTAFAPETRVSGMDKLRPWLGLGLGLLLFVFFVRTCASGGRLF
jgi:hypothetical protein